MARVFLDSGVFMQGISASWGAAKAVLILGASGVFSVETSEVVVFEVKAALARSGIATGPGSEFARLIQELKLVVHPRPSEDAVREGMELYLPVVRHKADIPVVVAAVSASPDWLVSSNTRHFNARVALKTGLRIVSPPQLLRYLQLTDVARKP
ncbi:MAG: hypothetical protein HY690_00445 [Chloroflexi bacterium]|nr:hypothetical protein [Chloroflexota bacterium]